jgi:PAS domain S-box-containing protein
MIENVCREVACFGNFSFVEIWLPDVRGESAMLSARYANGSEAATFYNENGVTSFKWGAGLPGSVWMTKKTVIWEELGDNIRFLRAKNALSAGIKSAIGVPLLHQDTIVGVMVVGSTEHKESLLPFASILSKMETFVGSEINRKRLELELRQLFHDLPDMVCLRALDGHWVRTNQACVDILGYSAEELASNDPNQFVHPDDRHIFAEQVKWMIETRKPVQFEKRHISKSGHIVWLNWNCRYNSDYGVIYATAKNVTEEKKLRELVEATTSLALVGSWELNLKEHDGDSMYWSPMLKHILEVPADYNPSFTGGFEFYTDESRVRIKKAVDRLIAEGIAFDEELQIITAKGSERWVRCIGSGQFIGDECVRIFGSYQDIHENKSLELQVAEILESISDAFYAADSSWRITYLNREAENLLGVASEDVRGKTLWDAFPAAAGTILETVYRRVATTGVSESFEYLYPADNRWYEIVAYGSKGGVSAYFKDITERKAAEDELEKAYETNRRILESIGDAFFTMDRNFTVLYWNRVAEELLGIKRETLLGKNLWDVFPDAVNLPSYENYHKVLETGQPITFEDYYGVWLEVNAAPSDEGLTVFFRDITKRKEADIQIRQANERFEKVTEATTDAIWDWDINNDYYYRGKGFDQLFGVDVSHGMRSDDFWKDSFHPDDLPALKLSVEAALSDPSIDKWQHEYRIVHKTDGTKTVVDKGVIIRDKSGKATRMVGAITDITYRKLYEEELLKLNDTLQEHIHDLEIAYEELEQFTYIASHDLQEPLRMISSFMDQLKRKYGDRLDDKAHQYIFYAMDGAKRMKKIILDLLEYSRAGKFLDKRELVNVDEILIDYQVLRRRIIGEKFVSLEVEKLPEVMAYRTPLVQVFHSLLDNAIRYSRDGVVPEVEVLSKDRGDHWLFMVRDNGIGIEEKFFSKIFVLFQRLHDRDSYDGTGIGLSIVKKHVDSWGGSVWVDSEVGKGSTFYFTIPK